MKVSNCCGVSGNKHTDIDPYCNEFYVDIEVCPKCKEHCEYVDESEPAPKPGSRKVFIEVEFKDHDRVILTNQYGDTYTSKSEELIDFLHEKQPAPKPKEGEDETIDYIHKGIEFSQKEQFKLSGESYRSGVGFGYSCGYQDGMKEAATPPSSQGDVPPTHNRKKPFIVANVMELFESWCNGNTFSRMVEIMNEMVFEWIKSNQGDVEEAANDYAFKISPQIAEFASVLHKAFKAGALWQSTQGQECNHNWVSSVAYKGAKVCSKCGKIK